MNDAAQKSDIFETDCVKEHRIASVTKFILSFHLFETTQIPNQHTECMYFFPWGRLAFGETDANTKRKTASK